MSTGRLRKERGNGWSKVPEWARERPGLRWMGVLIWRSSHCHSRGEVGAGGD